MTYTANTLILGNGTVTAAGIQSFFVARGQAAAPQFAPAGRYKAPPSDIGEIIVELSNQYGVNHDMMAAQIGHESAWWQSRIVRDKHNPSGLGATNDAPYENAITFPSPRYGIRATVAHLLSYTLGDESPLKDVSPRHEVLRRAGYLGIASVWRDLNGRWAWPGETYAQSIAARANDIVNHATQHGEIIEEGSDMSVAEKYGIRGLIDSRHLMATNRNGGPTNRRPLSQKQGAIVHYAGANQNLNLTDMQLWQSYATHHIRPNGFGQGYTGNGIMYHIGIDRDGSKHLLRDIELDAWHCGSWPENGIALSINLPIGGNQRSTKAALKSLREVCDDWIAAGHGDRSMIKGHQEVDPKWTACPGTLLQDFVIPYRNGESEQPMANYAHFPQTGHGIGHGFLDYWRDTGGVMIHGYPLTDELDEEVTIDGETKTLTVQYFERSVFEFHPDNEEPYRVLQRRLGADALKRMRSA
jgi:hypothetical protein